MIILSFDPGQSTGFCRIDFSRFYNRVESVYLHTFPNWMQAGIPRIDAKDGKVLVEKPPFYSSDPKLTIICRNLVDYYSSFSSVEEIFPSLWKPVARAKKWSCSLSKTQHENDAYCMARWWIWKTFCQDIGN